MFRQEEIQSRQTVEKNHINSWDVCQTFQESSVYINEGQKEGDYQEMNAIIHSS